MFMIDYWDKVEKHLQSFGIDGSLASELVSPYRTSITDNIVLEAVKFFGPSGFALGLYKRNKRQVLRKKFADKKAKNVQQTTGGS
jgi:hypothetical protein